MESHLQVSRRQWARRSRRLLVLATVGLAMAGGCEPDPEIPVLFDDAAQGARPVGPLLLYAPPAVGGSTSEQVPDSKLSYDLEGLLREDPRFPSWQIRGVRVVNQEAWVMLPSLPASRDCEDAVREVGRAIPGLQGIRFVESATDRP